MKFEVFCRYEDYAARLNFYIFRINPEGSRDLCTSMDRMEFVPYEENTVIEQASFSLTGRVVDPFLKEMANALSKIGIRADGEPVIENELTAVKYHLEDMRSLVFSEGKHRDQK